MTIAEVQNNNYNEKIKGTQEKKKRKVNNKMIIFEQKKKKKVKQIKFK